MLTAIILLVALIVLVVFVFTVLRDWSGEWACKKMVLDGTRYKQIFYKTPNKDWKVFFTDQSDLERISRRTKIPVVTLLLAIRKSDYAGEKVTTIRVPYLEKE